MDVVGGAADAEFIRTGSGYVGFMAFGVPPCLGRVLEGEGQVDGFWVAVGPDVVGDAVVVQI